MIKIRYYADDLSEQRHEKIIELLNEIHNRHRIPVEITRVRAWYGPIFAFRGSIEYLSEEDAWKRDFCRNKDLSRNLGEAPSKIFKSRSGNLCIAGTVGVVVDGILQWAAVYDEGLDFLQRVLELGNPKFGVVVGELAESELEKYDWNWRNFAKRMVEKEIDLVMENPEKDWIVEVKQEFYV